MGVRGCVGACVCVVLGAFFLKVFFLYLFLTEILMYTDLHVARIRARRGGRIRCVSGQSMTDHKDVD